MKIKVYPEEYDPRVAGGPPSEWFIKQGVTWTPEETAKMLELENQAIEMEIEDISQRPVGRWTMIV